MFDKKFPLTQSRSQKREGRAYVQAVEAQSRRLHRVGFTLSCEEISAPVPNPETLPGLPHDADGADDHFPRLHEAMERLPEDEFVADEAAAAMTLVAVQDFLSLIGE